MSSEALEPPFDREQILGRMRVVERGETTLYERALLAEVARLEQAWLESDKVAARQHRRAEAAEAALAVAREREQRADDARLAALSHVATVLGTMRGGASPELEAAHRVLATGLTDKARAALVDGPAAASSAWSAGSDFAHPAAATLAEPGRGEWKPPARVGEECSPVTADVTTPAPGSASAAADEPGETP